MKQFLITPDDLMKFMGEDVYFEFIDYLKEENKVPDGEAIWIIGEWSKEEEDEF